MSDSHRANLELAKIILRNGYVSPAILRAPLDEAQQKKLTPKAFMESLVNQSVLTAEQAQTVWADYQGDSLPDAVADFQILSKLGKGGMGVVYKAKQMGSGEMVALKVMRPSKTIARTSLDRFYREANAVMKLEHPNIVRGIDFGEVEGRHYLAMEFVEGKSLSDLETDVESIPPGQAVYVAICLARALAYAHAMQLVHRDVKPNNVIISTVGEVKLTDFGLSKWEEDAAANLTLAGTGMGTPYYMAPEQVRGAKFVDGRSDVYSLGATLYEMLAGRRPIEGKPMQVLFKLEQGEPITPLRQLNPAVPERLEAIAQRMMAYRPADRYQDAARLATDLEQFATRLPRDSFAGPLPIDPNMAVEVVKPTGATAIRMPAVKRKPPQPPPAEAPEPQGDALYYVKYRKPDGSPFIKPYDMAGMKQRIDAGRFNGGILVRRGEYGDFVRLDTIPELNEMLTEAKTLVGPPVAGAIQPPAPPEQEAVGAAQGEDPSEPLEEAETMATPRSQSPASMTPAPPLRAVEPAEPQQPAAPPPQETVTPPRQMYTPPPQPAVGPQPATLKLPTWVYVAIGGMGLVILVLLVMILLLFMKMSSGVS